MQTIARKWIRWIEGKRHWFWLSIYANGMAHFGGTLVAEHTANVGNHDGVDPTIDKEKSLFTSTCKLNLTGIRFFLKQHSIFEKIFLMLKQILSVDYLMNEAAE